VVLLTFWPSTISASSGSPSAIGEDAIAGVGTASARVTAGCIRSSPTAAVDSGTQTSPVSA
jgi:hypothetical protein